MSRRNTTNGVSFNGIVTDRDMCTMRKSHQVAHIKTVDHKVKYTFQLVFAGLMESITPEACQQDFEEYTTWTEIYLLKSKHDTLIASQVIMKSVVIPSGFRVEHLRTDKEGEYVRGNSNDYCL